MSRHTSPPLPERKRIVIMIEDEVSTFVYTFKADEPAGLDFHDWRANRTAMGITLHMHHISEFASFNTRLDLGEHMLAVMKRSGYHNAYEETHTASEPES